LQIHVTFRPRRQADRSVELAAGAVVRDLIEALGEHPEMMVAVRAGQPIAEDEILLDGESLLLLAAASGG
jgi:sulfur carrier protein ThiS